MGSNDTSGDGAAAPRSTPDTPTEDRWRLLIAELGAEVAHPLTAALERINTLTSSGRIDRAGLRSLREEIEAARQVGMTAQLLARFANARLRQSRERVALAEALQTVLTHRKRETETRGIVLKPLLKPVDVIVDPSLAFSLLNTLLDWALPQARAEIGFTIDVKSWTGRARLTCRFELSSNETSRPLDSLTWRLLEQTATTMNLGLTRQTVPPAVTVSIEFPLATKAEIDGISAVDLDQGFDSSVNSKPLAGNHVVVIASRREMRVRVRDAIRHMGLTIDLVASVEEAADFCRDGLPHAIVVESILHGERFDRLCAEIDAEVPGFPFIDIVEEGKEFSVSDESRNERARVGQEAIEAALPSVLMFELSRRL